MSLFATNFGFRVRASACALAESDLVRRFPSPRASRSSTLTFWVSLVASALAFLNTFAHTNSPTKLADIEYAQAGGGKLLLDISVPFGNGPFPVAIYIHGGGWTSGDKASTNDAPVLNVLTEARFTWFAVNYRLALQHRYAWRKALILHTRPFASVLTAKP